MKEVAAEKLKIRNLVLFNEGQKVEIKTERAKSDCLDFLNIFQLDTRSLIDIDRRMKLSTAVFTSNYNVKCLCETWLNENNQFRRTPTENIEKLDGDKNFHGGSLIAVKITSLLSKSENPFSDFMRSLQNKHKYIGCSYLRIVQPTPPHRRCIIVTPWMIFNNS